MPGELGRAADGLEADGKTVVFCGWDGVVRGLLAVGDSIKDGAAEVVAELRRMGLEVGMITGDTASAARTIASWVGIDTVLGEILPIMAAGINMRFVRDVPGGENFVERRGA